MTDIGWGIRGSALVAGAALIVAGFLPWANGVSGWELTAGVAALTLVAGLAGMVVGATGGRIGVFRPDVSVRGAADLLGLASTLTVGCVLLFDLPDGTGAELGAYVALIAAAAIAVACGDYRVLRDAPVFPRID
jgi:hypothetical protein